MRWFRRFRCWLSGGHLRGGELLASVGSLRLARCGSCGVPIFEHTAEGAYIVSERDVPHLIENLRFMRDSRQSP